MKYKVLGSDSNRFQHFTHILRNELRSLIFSPYAASSSLVGSDRTRSYAATPGRTSGRSSSASVPAGRSGSIAAVGLYFTFSVSLPRNAAFGPASSMPTVVDLQTATIQERPRAPKRPPPRRRKDRRRPELFGLTGLTGLTLPKPA